jgi:hypothetical protein
MKKNDACHIDHVDLAKMYKTKTRPKCPCRTPGVEMYIAKIAEDRYVVKRMPNTGSLHSPDCESYEPPPELSGLGDMLGTAIKENIEDGFTELKFGFSMSKVPGRAGIQKGNEVADSVKTEGNKLSMRSALHFLWEEAGFHKWAPAMTGKRTWFVIRKHLLQAAENKMVKGHPFLERLYIPEQFSVDHKDAITQRRIAHMSSMNSLQNGPRNLMILIGEVKEIAPARYGHKIIVKHAADFPFMLNDDLHRRLLKRFAIEHELWEALDHIHLVVIATFSISAAGIASVEEIALMTVTENWIPFETIQDKAVIETLTTHNRRFMKGLRYNLPQSRPLACAVLSDTAPQPTALYIVPAEADDDFLAANNRLIEESHLASWTWNASDFELPALPAATKT